MKKLILALAFVLVPAISFGQAVHNPTAVTFTASVDHAAINNYVLGWFAIGATDPLMEVNLSKPTPDGSQVCTATIDARPLAFGSYIVKVRAVAGAVTSEWSEPSNLGIRSPFPPTVPVVRK